MKSMTQWLTNGGVVLLATATALIAQAGPPTLSSNPGNLAIFPAKGQSPDQQMADEAARLAAPMMWSAVARRYHDMFAPLLSDYGMVGAPVLAGAGVRSQVA
jgi:hypothetical protein